MNIKNRMVALVFRLLMVIGSGTGLVLNSGITAGKFEPNMFVYYTILSNLVCFLFFIFLTVKTVVDIKKEGIKGTSTITPHFKGAVVMMITVTMLIYHFLLVPNAFSMDSNLDIFNLSNILVHYFTPSMVILDWLLFDKKNTYRWFDPLVWIIIPYVYFAFALIRAQFLTVVPDKTRYVYFFIDVDVLGWAGVLKNVAIITLFFLALGYIIFGIDKIPYNKIFKNKEAN